MSFNGVERNGTTILLLLLKRGQTSVTVFSRKMKFTRASMNRLAGMIGLRSGVEQRGRT